MTNPNDPFEDPASSVGLDFNSLKGSLLMIDVLGEDDIPTQFTRAGDPSPCIRANLTVIDGREAGTIYDDILIFPKGLFAQLRSKIGKVVLGRLTQGEAKPGQNPPWRLAPATEQDKANARQALAATRVAAATAPGSEPPF